jgi:hypothetical protein
LLAFLVMYFVPIVEGMRAQAPPAPLPRLEIPTLAFPSLSAPRPARASKLHARATASAAPTRVRQVRRQTPEHRVTPAGAAVRAVPVVTSSYTVAPQSAATGGAAPQQDPFANETVVESGFGVAPPPVAPVPEPAAVAQAPAAPADVLATPAATDPAEQLGYPAGGTATRFFAMHAGDESEASSEEASQPAAEPTESVDAAAAAEATDAAEPETAEPAAEPLATTPSDAVAAPAPAA